MKYRNPLMKTIRRVFAATGGSEGFLVLASSSRQFNADSGEIEDVRDEVHYRIVLKNPHSVSEAIVDGKNYLHGDVAVDVPFIDIIEACGQAGRACDAHSGWGINPAEDKVIFSGGEWNIAKVSPGQFWNGMPSVARLVLRSR